MLALPTLRKLIVKDIREAMDEWFFSRDWSIPFTVFWNYRETRRRQETAKEMNAINIEVHRDELFVQ